MIFARSRLLVFLLVCAAVFPLVLGLGMMRGLSHDEHQHVSAGALIAREGLLPYRDFSYFHTPYLPFAYALLFRLTDHLLVAARLLSVLSAVAILGLVGSFAWHAVRERGRRTAALVCTGAVLLALATRLFSETTGHAGNHEPAVLLTLLAVFAHLAGLRTPRAGWFVASGVLLGLAIGVRLTCAPLIAPFGLALFFFPPPAGWHWRRAGFFTGGLLLGLAGVLYLFAIAPEQAFYDNLGFAQTNIVYRFSTGEPRTMTWPTKLRFFFKLIVRPEAALFTAGFLPVLVALWAQRGTGRRFSSELRFLLLLLPFVLIGSFAPSPLFDQYFFPLVPLLLLTGLSAWAAIPQESPWSRRTLLVAAAALVLAIGLGWRGYDELPKFLSPSYWQGVELHRGAQKLRASLQRGQVLTLAPIYPLEAGLAIYPAFSTGPFAWRISPYVEPAKAARLGIISPATLEAVLAAEPPAAILIGHEKVGEELLSAYARQHRYRPVPLREAGVLWVPR